VKVSVGELSEIVHAAAQAGKKEVEALLGQVLAAPVVQADETGWRENGRNGWLWSFSTPESSERPIRYFHYDASRAKTVVEGVLGETFCGVLVTDFYAAYSAYLGRHQRCWVHLLRDLHELKKKHPDDPTVAEGMQAVKQVYDTAKAWHPPRPNTRFEERDRRQAQGELETELRDLAKPFLSDPNAPQHTLAHRIEKFLQELFVFVADPRVPSDNNGAERSLRPSVIARKISGGTRSEKGSKTRTTLMTLFATWKLQGKDLLETCRQMLLAPPSPMRVVQGFPPLPA
jgi:transposase